VSAETARHGSGAEATLGIGPATVNFDPGSSAANRVSTRGLVSHFRSDSSFPSQRLEAPIRYLWMEAARGSTNGAASFPLWPNESGQVTRHFGSTKR